MDYEYSEFYENAMALFRTSGFTATSTPISTNRTFKQTVYLDSERTIYVERGLLNCAYNISHLFDLDDTYFYEESGAIISFYSVQLNCLMQHRSSMAHDVHAVLHSSFSADASVVLFCHEGKVLLSIADVDGEIILSEWYDLFYDFGRLADHLNIGQFSGNTSREFSRDLIYTVARQYYLEPPLEGMSVYSIIPIDYYGNGLLESESAEGNLPIKEFLSSLIKENEIVYGDDYVEPRRGTICDMSAIDDELARLSFELELEEESLVANDDDENAENDTEERDEYEFSNVNNEIFEDPVLMLKWLDTFA